MRSPGSLVLALALVGCYGPSAQLGVPCSADLECPGAQVCDVRIAPPTCVDTLAPEVDAGIDAPVPCMVDLECTSAEAPICGAEGTCRGCVADSECPSDVCHELAGTCVAEAAALYVAPAAVGTTCTRLDPCGTLEAALDLRTPTRFTIKVADGSYLEGFEIRDVLAGDESLTVVISGADRGWEGAVITAVQREVRVESGYAAVIEGLTLLDGTGNGIFARGDTTVSRCLIQGANGDGIQARNESLRVLDSRIEANGNAGIRIEGGTGLEVERTLVIGHAGGPGITVQNTGFTIVNTIIANNGTISTTNGGVRLDGSAGQPAVFRHNTVVNNRAGFSNAAGVHCDDATTIENSILANNMTFTSSNNLSANCSARHSLFAQNAPQGMGNKLGDPMFASTTDFHILAGSLAIDAADGAVVEALDIDGQLRPNGDKPDCGADELY